MLEDGLENNFYEKLFSKIEEVSLSNSRDGIALACIARFIFYCHLRVDDILELTVTDVFEGDEVRSYILNQRTAIPACMYEGLIELLGNLKKRLGNSTGETKIFDQYTNSQMVARDFDGVNFSYSDLRMVREMNGDVRSYLELRRAGELDKMKISYSDFRTEGELNHIAFILKIERQEKNKRRIKVSISSALAKKIMENCGIKRSRVFELTSSTKNKKHIIELSKQQSQIECVFKEYNNEADIDIHPIEKLPDWLFEKNEDD